MAYGLGKVPGFLSGGWHHVPSRDTASLLRGFVTTTRASVPGSAVVLSASRGTARYLPLLSQRRFLRSMSEPAPGSCPLHAGHRGAHRQAPATPCTTLISGPSFDDVAILSTPRRGFTDVQLPRHTADPVWRSLLPSRPRPGIFLPAADGGLKSPPARRFRGAIPHLRPWFVPKPYAFAAH